MRIKAPFTIELKRKIKGKYAIQFLKDSHGNYLGQFNTNKGVRTGTFTPFLMKTPKLNGQLTTRDDSADTWYTFIVESCSGAHILNRVWHRLYHNEPTSAAQTQALFTVSQLLAELE
jgi:hypothetical protein